jgi:hypothetical protein
LLNRHFSHLSRTAKRRKNEDYGRDDDRIRAAAVLIIDGIETQNVWGRPQPGAQNAQFGRRGRTALTRDKALLQPTSPNVSRPRTETGPVPDLARRGYDGVPLVDRPLEFHDLEGLTAADERI